MKTFLNNLYYSQLWTVLAAPSFVWASDQVWGNVPGSYYLFFTLATIAVYGADRHFTEFSPEDEVNQPGLVRFHRKFRPLFRLLIIGSFIGSIITLIHLPPVTDLLLVGLFLVTVLQLVPVIPWVGQDGLQFKSLKQFAILKPWVIVMVWWAAGVFIPAYSFGRPGVLTSNEFWWYSGGCMALIYFNAVLFDILDLPGDRRLRPGFHGRPGPVRLIRRLVVAAWAATTGLACWAFFQRAFLKDFNIGLLGVFTLFAILVILITWPRIIQIGWRNKVLARIVLDGLFVISGPFTWLTVWILK